MCSYGEQDILILKNLILSQPSKNIEIREIF